MVEEQGATERSSLQLQLPTSSAPKALFGAESDDRIDSRGAAGGEPGGDERDEDEQAGDGGNHTGVERARLVEQRTEQPIKGESA